MYMRFAEDSFALEVREEGVVLEATEGYDGVHFRKCAGELKTEFSRGGYWIANRGVDVPIAQEEINVLLATAILTLHRRMSEGM